MTFWAAITDYLGLFLWIVILIGYLMAVFTILTDLMRDHSLPGWGKAIWVVALIAVPFITLLIYLIARGRGIASRQQVAFNDARKATDDYIRTVAGSNSPATEIDTAHRLMRDGAISPTEFEALKAKALTTVPA